MKTLSMIAAFSLLAAPLNSLASDGCDGAPKPVGKCWVVHGRLSVYNGAWSAVIWPVGTKRLLAVGGPEDHLFLPAELTAQLVTDGLENFIYGDFAVCPLSREQPGQIQFVCVQSAAKVAVKRARVKAK